MTSLDPRSIIAVASLMSALMAVVLFFMRRSYPRDIHGLGHWAAAAALWLLASIIFANRDAPWPEGLLILVPNVLLVLGSIVYLAGCQRFFGQPVHWQRWWFFLGLASVVYAWFIWGPSSFRGRLLVSTCMMAIVYLANLWFLLRHGNDRLPVRMIEIILFVHLMVLVLRTVTALDGQSNGHLYEQTAIQILYLGSFVVCQLLYCIGAILMATDRLAAEYARQARLDPLTGIWNRRALLEHCSDELLRSVRTGRGPALLMLDLDHFKAINDAHGHQHGDEVLHHFAHQVRAVLRPEDRVGRYGGEEFTVLLPAATQEAAHTVAQRIHTTLASGHRLDSQVSIGIAVWHGSSDTLDAMLERADRALYMAKEQGRNCTRMA